MDFLTRYAFENVWCAPDQDKHVIFKPARLTRPLGEYQTIKTLWVDEKLPSTDIRYHAFQIGQIPSAFLGFSIGLKEWVSLIDVSNDNNVVFDLYNETGVKYPLSEAYIKINDRENMLIAIKKLTSLPDFGKENFYFKIYNPAYLQRGSEEEEGVVVGGGHMLNEQMIVDNIVAYNQFRQLPGYTELTINGYQHGVVNKDDVAVGDYFVFRYDSTVKRVQDIKLSDLPVFDSELDSLRKYFFHFPKSGATGIDYRDDCEMFLINKGVTDNKFEGIFVHNNIEQSLRMVTHQDYSIPTAFIDSFKGEFRNGTLGNLTLRIIQRKSGFEGRELVNEANHINELYKLDDKAILSAIVGPENTLPEWRVQHLESSTYTELMRTTSVAIEKDALLNTFGYNAIMRIIADTPLRAYDNGGKKSVNLLDGQMDKCTIYEYSRDGRLLRHGVVSNILQYDTINPACAFVEIFPGEGGDRIDQHIGIEPVSINPDFNYRYYVRDTVSDTWEDVTGTDKYSIVDNVVFWDIDKYSEGTAFSDDLFLHNHWTVENGVDGLIRVPYGELSRVQGTVSANRLQFPMGRIDVWLNNRPILEGIDWFKEEDNYHIVITNKEFLKEDGSQDVFIRITGFPTSDLEWHEIEEVGFVKHGLLSRNNRFDLRDGKVARIILDGSVRLREDVVFSEDTYSVYVRDDEKSQLNGRPYRIEFPKCPYRRVNVEDFEAFVSEAGEVEKRVSNYMTEHYPQPPIDEIMTIRSKYNLYSPFSSRIIQAFRKDELVITGQRIIDAEMDFMLAPYMFLLDSDPCTMDLDWDFLAIHPHEQFVTKQLTQPEYVFLERVNERYLNGHLDLSRFITILK